MKNKQNINLMPINLNNKILFIYYKDKKSIIVLFAYFLNNHLLLKFFYCYFLYIIY